MDKTRIELETLITEREGMMAENAECAYKGQAMAYVDEAFTELATQMRKLVKEEALPVIANYLTKEAEERAYAFHEDHMSFPWYAYNRVLRLIAKCQGDITGVCVSAISNAEWKAMERLRITVKEWEEEAKKELLCSP